LPLVDFVVFMNKFYPLLLIGLAACDIFDEEEPIPSYVYIESADLVVPADGSRGADTEAIVDAHVFANEAFVGTIELPGKVAILEEGNTRITIGAGIRNNGITSNRVIYPFYQFYHVNLDLVPDALTPISADSVAVFNYFSDEDVDILLEEFEGVGNIWEPADNGGTGIVNIIDPEEVLTGNGSGKITLDNDNPTLEVYSAPGAWDFSSIFPGTPVYMELDYRGNNPLEIGIRTTFPQTRKIFALGLNPSDEWVKVYVELTNEIGMGQTNDFQIYLESEKVIAEPLVEIFLDNMKLVYPN